MLRSSILCLSYIINTVSNIYAAKLYQNWGNIMEKCKWNKNCTECYIWINFIALWLNENRRSAFFQWQQFCTCVPNQHQLALGWYFFGPTLLSGRKPDLCCTSIIENSKEKKNWNVLWHTRSKMLKLLCITLSLTRGSLFLEHRNALEVVITWLK